MDKLTNPLDEKVSFAVCVEIKSVLKINIKVPNTNPLIIQLYFFWISNGGSSS